MVEIYVPVFWIAELLEDFPLHFSDLIDLQVVSDNMIYAREAQTQKDLRLKWTKINGSMRSAVTFFLAKKKVIKYT